MTHKDIYIKFAIEYDNANTLGSKPTLTEYDIAQFLDKAYKAVLAQKITANNFRRSGFEYDIKAVEDIRPLLKRIGAQLGTDNIPAKNVYSTNLPNDLLYYIDCYLQAIKNEAVITKNTKTIRAVETPLRSELFNGRIDASADEIASTLGIDISKVKTAVVTAKYGYIVSSIDEWLGTASLRYSGEDKGFIAVGVRQKEQGEQQQEREGSVEYELFNPKYIQDIEKKDVESLRTLVKSYPKYALLFPVVPCKDEPSALYFYYTTTQEAIKPYDQENERLLPTKLLPHEQAKDFFSTSYNMPWIKIPIVYIEDDTLFVVYDPLNDPIQEDCEILYIKNPHTFVKDLDQFTTKYDITFFECPSDLADEEKELYEFECSTSMAEEIINLAIAFALENTGSQRLNSKLNMRGLEA